MLHGVHGAVVQEPRPPAASEEPRCAVHDIPDDLLRQILLRLDSPLWILRAACTCKRWRRVVTDGGADAGRAFLRLARSLHPPVVVGHYLNDLGRGHLFVATSPTPIRLSLDFFPPEFVHCHRTIHPWYVTDCHGGLVLLREGFNRLSKLVVCDPFSRRYRDIHRPPQVISSHPLMGSYWPRVFLLDGGDGGNISISNFRVVYYCSTDSNIFTKVYVFSTADDGGDWRLVRRSTAEPDDLFSSYKGHVVIGRIDGSLYTASPAGSVRVLDNARLVFTEVNLPIRVWTSYLDCGHSSTFAVVHGTSPEPTASLATAYIVHVLGDELELFRQISGSGEWVLQHSIHRLSQTTRGLVGYPERARWRAVGVIAGGTRLAVFKVFLTRGDRCFSWLFSLDVDTMQLKAVPDRDVATYLSPDASPPIIYTLPWPQFLTAQAS